MKAEVNNNERTSNAKDTTMMGVNHNPGANNTKRSVMTVIIEIRSY